MQLFSWRGSGFFNHCWVFQICWHIECSTLAAASFRIWNSLAGIPSLPLALFVVMLPKAHLTSHSKVSRSRWVTALTWVIKTFLYGSVYSCHFISSASVRSLSFLSFIVVILAWNVPLIPPVLLKRSLVFSVFLCFFHCSFKKACLSLLTTLWNFAFDWVYLSFSPLPFTSLLSSAVCKAFSDNYFGFFHFFFFGMALVTI